MFTYNKLTVLYIESNHALRKKYSSLMEDNGLKVLKTDNMTTGCDLFRTHKVDILLVDLELPNHDGLDFIRCLRNKEIYVPAIIATVKTDKNTLFDAINLEITRYLIKPFTNNALVEALHIAIKKVTHGQFTTFAELHDGFSYDPINKCVNAPDGTAIQLSKKESLLLELLIKNRKQIISYSDIEEAVWQDSIMSLDALRTLVRSIRKKTYPTIISNHNGIGYKINLS